MKCPALSSILAATVFVAPPRCRDCGLHSVEAQIQRCHEKCKKCHLFDYNQEWHCLECFPGYALWVDGCFLPCPQGEFRYGYDCQKCGIHCEECVGTLDHECLKCLPGYHLSYTNRCVKDCPRGKYTEDDGSGCGKCNAYCKTCIAQYMTSCTSCYDGYTLRIHEPYTKSGECMQRCPDPYFRDSANDLRCIQCGEYCLKCNSLYNCSKCESYTTLSNGKCYNTAQVAVSEGISFKDYLESGAGKQWTGDGPSWEAVVSEALGVPIEEVAGLR